MKIYIKTLNLSNGEFVPTLDEIKHAETPQVKGQKFLLDPVPGNFETPIKKHDPAFAYKRYVNPKLAVVCYDLPDSKEQRQKMFDEAKKRMANYALDKEKISPASSEVFSTDGQQED